MGKYTNEYKQMIIKEYLSGTEWSTMEAIFEPARSIMQTWVHEYLLANPEETIQLYEAERADKQQLLESSTMQLTEPAEEALEQLPGLETMETELGVVTDDEMLAALKNHEPNATVYYQVIMSKADQRYLEISDDQVAHLANLPVADTFTYFHDTVVASAEQIVELELLEHNASGTVILQGYQASDEDSLDTAVHIDWLLDQFTNDGQVDIPENNVRLVYNVLDNYAIEKLKQSYLKRKAKILAHYQATGELIWF